MFNTICGSLFFLNCLTSMLESALSFNFTYYHRLSTPSPWCSSPPQPSTLKQHHGASNQRKNLCSLASPLEALHQLYQTSHHTHLARHYHAYHISLHTAELSRLITRPNTRGHKLERHRNPTYNKSYCALRTLKQYLYPLSQPVRGS
jgi:hypothetical protein